MSWTSSVTPEALLDCLGTRQWPIVIDVRRRSTYDLAETIIPTAIWRHHQTAGTWGAEYTGANWLVIYCAHGEELSQGAAMVLRSIGLNAVYLKDGISGWRAGGGAILSKEMQNGVRRGGPSEWMTWHDEKVTELACPWFIRRFIDPDGRVHFVERDLVSTIAEEFSAIPFDIPEAPFRLGENASNLDTLIRYFQVVDPALDQLARVVRGTEQNSADAVAQHAGLLAISSGLKDLAETEQQLLSWSMSLYDALYRWARNHVRVSRPIAPQP